MLRELTEPFVRLTAAEASELLKAHWGIDATGLDRLDTERDDSFRVRGVGDRVLKVAHPLDDARLVGLQTSAMMHVACAGLPVQEVVVAAGGHTAVVIDGRIARVLTWLPGGLMRDAEYGLEAVTATGTSLARVAAALADVADPAAHRTFAWDLRSFASLEHPPALDPVFERFAAVDLEALPHQMIHNDFHPGNLLVDADDPNWITGILDFGDTLYAPRVQDLGVALAYLLPEADDPAPVVAAFVEGYERVTPLLPAEHAALLPLVAARLVQRIILPPLIDPGAVDPPHVARLTRTLANLTGRL